VALGFESNSPRRDSPRRDESRRDQVFPLDLDVVLDGLARDAAWLAPAFPGKLLELWIARKRAEAEYVYNAPTPQEYELYF